MKKTDLLSMRVEGGDLIYLGRKGKTVIVLNEAGEELDITKLPVYPRKYIKQKLESIPEIKGELDASDFEGCDGGITGQDDEAPADDASGSDDDSNDNSNDDSDDDADKAPEVDATPADETPADDSSEEESSEEEKTEEAPATEDAKEEALPTKLKDLKELAEKLRLEVEAKTGKDVKVDIQSLRSKKEVIAKIDKLKELLK